MTYVTFDALTFLVNTQRRLRLVTARAPTGLGPNYRPWPALWAMVIGFFMILVDSTIVSVATPTMQRAFDADYNSILWVTSSYLLAYAVPLLITGRLGDKFGPKRLYLVGLTIFTTASLLCALTTTIESLIGARVVQGLGASLMTPQTMSVITRTFEPQRRGRAMALWGATAGVATMVGPILGGVLVQFAGWESIFWINVPVGIIGFILAWRWVPNLPTQDRRFDWLGVALSGTAMFLIVFGIQEGSRYNWGQISGLISVPALIVSGLLVLGVFVWWQHRQSRSLAAAGAPLVPLRLFADRNFSVGSTAIALVAFGVTSMAFPFMLWAQNVRGWEPVQAGMALIPMAIVTTTMAPIVGRLTDRFAPRVLATGGFVCSATALTAMSVAISPTTAIPLVLVLLAGVGFGNAFLWAPIAATATRNLPPADAGAGSGVYNSTRQLGAVLGSAAIATALQARISVRLPDQSINVGEGATATVLDAAAAEAFSVAMSEAILVPAIAFFIGALVVQLFERRRTTLGGPTAP